MKLFVYNRKSTKDKEDQQILSLQGQQAANEQKALKEGHTIVDTFDEEKSAKEPGRECFNEMIRRIEAGEAEAIVCWRLNRLARNPIDGGRIQWLLQQGVIQSIITSEKTYLPSDNVIQMSVEFGMSTQYSLDLSKDVKRGMKQKAEMGWKPGQVSIGYMNDFFGDKGSKIVHKDPERFDLVKKCWGLLLTGSYTVPEIHELAVGKWGLTSCVGKKRRIKPFALNSMYRMFHDEFYYGMFQWDDKWWQGKHEPMITKEEFEKAQEILGRTAKPNTEVHANDYAGAIICGECSSAVVIDTQTKFIKRDNCDRTYLYYRCGKGKSTPCSQRGTITKKQLEAQITDLIDNISIPQAFIDWGLDKLRLSQQDKQQVREQELEGLQKRKTGAEKKIDELINLRLENPHLFTPEKFDTKYQELEKGRDSIEEQINDHNSSVTTWRDDVIDSLEFVERLKQKFQSGDAKTKLTILYRLGSPLELENKELTIRLSEPFQTFLVAREQAKNRLGSLEPIMCSLEAVKADLSNVIPIWSRPRDLNS